MADEFDTVEIADRLRIMDAIARYSWALDSGNLDDYLQCFTPDAILRHPMRDGSAGAFRGREGIADFFGPGFRDRAMQGYGHQHQFNAIRMAASGKDIKVDAYVAILRHEFHRQYWPRGSSFRVGTWHALFAWQDGRWRVSDLDIKMWTDTAFGNGTALVDRGPGMPGIRD